MADTGKLAAEGYGAGAIKYVLLDGFVPNPSGSSGAGFSRAQVVNNTMEPLKLSTARNLPVFLADSSDHITGKTGLTLTIKVSKDGGAFASITPTVTELGDGWYNLALTTTHTNTLGDLAFHITATGADPCDFKLPVEVDRTGATVSSVTGNVAGNVSGSVGSVTGNVSGSVGSLAAQAKTDVNAEVVDALSVDVVADSVPADGSRPTIAQALYMLTQFMCERSVSGTTLTVKKVDGSTTLMTFTLDDATSPTSISRAS